MNVSAGVWFCGKKQAYKRTIFSEIVIFRTLGLLFLGKKRGNILKCEKEAFFA